MQLFMETIVITHTSIGQPGSLGFERHMRLSNNSSRSPKGGQPETIFKALWQGTNAGTVPGEPGFAAVPIKGILIAE